VPDVSGPPVSAKGEYVSSVNIDKKAETVAKALMGLVPCPRCGGEGFSHNDVTDQGIEKLCYVCSGGGWVDKHSWVKDLSWEKKA
jgi:DnaJ-class molecular chaperone